MVFPASGQLARDLCLDEEVERQIAPARFAGAAFLDGLSTMPGACAFILARQEIHLHLDLVSVHIDGPVVDERLAGIGLVASGQNEPLDGPVAGVREGLVIQGKVHIDTAHVAFRVLRQQQLRNPTANDYNAVAILAEQAYEFQQYGFRRRDLAGGVVAIRYRHNGWMTSCNTCPAASPLRPLAAERSR